jgi:hypothetical protein
MRDAIREAVREKREAIKEAEAYAKEHKGEFIGVFDDPNNERSNSFDFHNTHFSRKRFRSGKTGYIGTPSQEFFDIWRQKKDELKHCSHLSAKS